MAEIKGIVDDYGILLEAHKLLPSDCLRVSLLEALAELENNEHHRTRAFPKTRLHRVAGVKEAIYRADIDKTSGWRLHLQYEDDKRLHLKDIIPGQDHDNVVSVIKAKRVRYT